MTVSDLGVSPKGAWVKALHVSRDPAFWLSPACLTLENRELSCRVISREVIQDRLGRRSELSSREGPLVPYWSFPLNYFHRETAHFFPGICRALKGGTHCHVCLASAGMSAAEIARFLCHWPGGNSA
jgi:hypothetical protein